jgi:hypothetical protein
MEEAPRCIIVTAKPMKLSLRHLVFVRKQWPVDGVMF